MRVSRKTKLSWQDAYAHARDKVEDYFDLDGMPIGDLGYAEIYEEIMQELESKGVVPEDAQSLAHCVTTLFWPMELVYR
jgi:hypothetical protein